MKGIHVPNYCFAKAFAGETLDCLKEEASVETGAAGGVQASRGQNSDDDEGEACDIDSNCEVEASGSCEVEKGSGGTKKNPYGKTWEFKGESCIAEFIRTFTKGQLFVGTIFIAHYSKGHDGYFILHQNMLKRCICGGDEG